MAYPEIEEMTKRCVIGVWTHGFYDGWAPNYLLSIANNHNSIGRFYETFGNGGADTRVRTLRPSDTSREWYRPNPPLARVKWSARDNINMQESAILFGMNNVASNGQKFLNNFYLKSKGPVGKARAEGPAAWVFPADDPRPAEQASLLNLFELQGIEVHRAEKEIRLPAASSGHDPDSRKEKSSADAKSREEKKPAETVIPAGSYVVRMDQPYSRLADMVLDTQYYSPRDPRSYDDTGWTLGALRGVKTMRITDVLILAAPMRKVGKIDPPGGVAGTWLRENSNLREKFDVLILPPLGGGGAAGLSSVIRGLAMRGGPRPWQNTDDTPNFVAPGLDSTADIRGGLGYQGLANLERFVSDGGLLLAVQSSAALPVAGGMTEMVNVSDPRAMQAPGSVVVSTIDDKKSPITYGYDDKLYLYFRQGPVITVGGIFGGFGPEEGPGASARSSGRGSLSDPDVDQPRPYMPPEKTVKRTPHEQELYVPEDLAEFARWAIPPADQQPRVVLRFAAEKDLLVSGMITGANEIAEKPAVVDVPHGKGHVVLFANNPIWRAETTGSYFLVFNAILNFDHLSAGAAAPTPSASATTTAGGEDNDQN